MANLDLWFALLAAVLTLSALVSGLVDRAPLSFPMLFLGLGLLLGPGGLGVIEVGPRHPALAAVATVSLALVLFLDALNLRVDELRPDWRVPLLALGPGTLLTVAGVALAGHLLLGLTPLVGLAVGGVGAWLMGRADAGFAIRREYQALYGLGLVLGAYAAAQA